jgi:heptosyltransferase II
VMRGASLVVANDSGPMHLAAAVDAPVLGIFGNGEPGRTHPWGSTGRWVGSPGRWPSLEAVLQAVHAIEAAGLAEVAQAQADQPAPNR